ncbi:hypothetical protein [Streptomyces olivaceiscleroticus]|uniref:Ricin B lectin domain-containing protein n=1 Tax=Streptomyces olivaceiscleroticus TaxID=68245 RepID=A0ABP3KPE2_9ACTN
MPYRIKVVSGALVGAALLLAQAGVASAGSAERPAAPAKGDFRIASAVDGRCLAPRAVKDVLDLSLITCGSQGVTDVFGLKPHADRFQLRSEAKKGCLGTSPARKLMFPSCSAKHLTDWTFTRHGDGYQIRRTGTDPSRSQLRAPLQTYCLTEVVDRAKGDRVALRPCSDRSPRQVWKLKPVRQAVAPKPDPVQQPAGKPEPGKPQAAKPEPAKPEPGKPEAAKPDAGKPQPAKPEAAQHQATEPQAAKPQGVQPQGAKPAAGQHPAATKPAGARPEAGQLPSGQQQNGQQQNGQHPADQAGGQRPATVPASGYPAGA